MRGAERAGEVPPGRRDVLETLMLRTAFVAAFLLAFASSALGDGKLVRPREYEGSLEETSQEAIIVFQGGDDARSAREYLILKVSVKGGALAEFAWVIPFP